MGMVAAELRLAMEEAMEEATEADTPVDMAVAHMHRAATVLRRPLRTPIGQYREGTRMVECSVPMAMVERAAMPRGVAPPGE